MPVRGRPTVLNAIFSRYSTQLLQVNRYKHSPCVQILICVRRKNHHAVRQQENHNETNDSLKGLSHERPVIYLRAEHNVRPARAQLSRPPCSVTPPGMIQHRCPIK